MRECPRDQRVDLLRQAVVTNDDEIARLPAIPFPCILNPRVGAGSQPVVHQIAAEWTGAHPCVTKAYGKRPIAGAG
jgi:hypothetical protein